MAGTTDFPTTIDTNTKLNENLVDGPTGDDVLAAHINNAYAAIKAIETKVGANASAVSTSIDYVINTVLGRVGNNIDILGTLDVTGVATFDSAVTVTGTLTPNGTATYALFNKFVNKAADTGRNSTITITDDPHLTTSQAANTTWLYEAHLLVSQAGGGFKFGITVPAGATGTYMEILNKANANLFVTSPTITPTGTHTAANMGTDVLHIYMRFTVATVGTAGTVAFGWAQDASNVGTTTIYAQSGMKATRIA